MSRFPGNIIKLPNVTPTQSSASGVWSLKDQMVYQRNNLWPFQRDPYFNYTTLLLQGNVPNTTGPQAMTLPLAYNADASTNNFLVTPNGDVGPRPFSPYFGGNYSVYFDGSSSLTPSSGAFMNLGTNNYTIEFFVFLTSNVGNNHALAANATNGLVVVIGDSKTTLNKYGIGDVVSTGSGLATNTWHHVAIVRAGTGATDTAIYINGVRVVQGQDNNNWTVTSNVRVAGNTSNQYITGYVSNLRVVTSAIYSGAFINVPTLPFSTAQSGTTFLTCQNNRFLDNGTTGATFTTTGSPRITDNSPFVSTDFTTGAGYFDGSDYLTVASNSAFTFTGDFTWEGWFYMTANPSQARSARLIDYNATGNFLVFTTSDGTDYLGFVVAGTSYSTTTALPRNQWAHVAVSRSGTGANNLKMFLNGTAISTQSNNSTITAAQIYISNAPGFDGYFTGYISGYRLTNTGSSTITVPTAPATTASALLTLQTRAPSQNISFLDSSPNEFLVTKNGNTTQGTFSPFSPTGWGNYFNGSNYLSFAHASLSANFTIEFWVYRTVGSTLQSFVFLNSGSTNGAVVYVDASNYLVVTDGSVAQSPFTGQTIPINAWTHIAVVRSGGTTTGYINGSSVGSNGFTPQAVNSVNIAYYVSANPLYLTGYVSNVRIVNGQALYTGNFTPAAAPLTTSSVGTSGANVASSITGTVSLLTCQSNRFVNNANNASPTAIVNSPSVQAFSPFAPANAVSPLVTGGSGYFDGTTDWLTVPDSPAFTMGSGDFTIESWVYCTASDFSLSRYIIAQRDNSSDTSISFAINFIGGGARKARLLVFNNAGASYEAVCSTDILNLNEWTHIAGVRDGATLRIYINGVQQGTANISTATLVDSSGSVAVGRLGDSNQYYWLGYTSGVRVVKGTCLYPGGSIFTPPTTPPTAIPNTSILLNFTNGAAVDATGKNNLESVGKAQNSGVQAKWDYLTGGSSMYFNGTGDYLVASSSTSDLTNFGAGNFTVEAWVRFVTAGGDRTICAKFPGLTNRGWAIFTASTNLFYFTYSTTGSNATDVSFSWTPSANVWYFVTVVRNGADLKAYIDGSQIGSTHNIGTSSIFGSTAALTVGARGDTTIPMTGYISNLRVTKGIARPISVPTGPFPIG